MEQLISFVVNENMNLIRSPSTRMGYSFHYVSPKLIINSDSLVWKTSNDKFHNRKCKG